MDLIDYLDSAKNRLFRFEALQTYDVSEERESYMEFIKTGKLDFSVVHEWWDFIEKKVTQGVAMDRVRLIKYPLTTYTQYELGMHRESIKHGDTIKVIEEASFSALHIPEQDFWLVDDLVLGMKYDAAGKYLGFDLVDPIEGYIKNKDLLILHSTGLDFFKITS